ncbi:Replication protein A [Theobroma cacao]|nr:Replication protein A [Theobroma cacao]
MHFMIRSSDASQFRPQLKEGCLYSIKKFQINNKKTSFNPIPSNIMGMFTKNTVIQTIQDNLDAYPTNFIGALKSITTIEKVHLQNRTSDVKKRDLYIEDLSGNTLKVVFHGDKAEAIDEDQLLDNFISPIVIVAATTVKKYMSTTYLASCSATKFYVDLNIPETMLHKQRYEKEPFSVQIINIHMSPQQLSTKEYEIKDSTLADINNADPTEVQGTKFRVKGTIVDIDCSNGWFYN